MKKFIRNNPAVAVFVVVLLILILVGIATTKAAEVRSSSPVHAIDDASNLEPITMKASSGKSAPGN